LAFSHALGQRFPAPQFRVCRAGLEPFASFGNNRFFKVADDFEGHPQLLSIFDKSKQYSGPQNIEPDSANAGAGTLHHFAFAMEKEQFAQEKERLQGIGLDIQFAGYKQLGWRSIHFHDPDGNSLEFVGYDSSIIDVDENKPVRHTNSQEAQ
jgi:catechol 2,3-dioxygenase-like lactoylglutathione lyase family enzyme